jgi:large conductance mechanosensitive channel
MLKEFKDFLLRGNLLELAVAVVVGAAFTGVVNALVKDLLTPLIAAIGGKSSFNSLTFTVNHSQFNYGAFLNAVISFLLVATVIFFLVVKPVNHLLNRLGRTPEQEAPVRECPECLSKVPVAATRCAACTSPLVPVPGLDG